MFPQPVLALVVLFPMRDKIVKWRKIIHKKVLSLGHEHQGDGVWYVKQRIQNACGTIGERNGNDSVRVFTDNLFCPLLFLSFTKPSCRP